MSDSFITENDFLKQITAVIEENLSNEQFGVSELAHEIGMSRSNLLAEGQKIDRIIGESVYSAVAFKPCDGNVKTDFQHRV